MSTFRLAIDGCSITSLNDETEVVRIARAEQLGGTLTLIVVDDEMNKVFYSPSEYGRGDDVYIIRRVLSLLGRNPLVREVYALEFWDSGLEWLRNQPSIRERLQSGNVRFLLDIYGPEKEPHGEGIARQLLSTWSLLPRDINAFSKSDSQALEEMGIEVGISKPDGKTTEQYERDLERQAQQLVERWFAPHSSRYRKTINIDGSLTELGAADAALNEIGTMCRQALHEHKDFEDRCHTVAACLSRTNRAVCQEQMDRLMSSDAFDSASKAVKTYLRNQSCELFFDAMFPTSEGGVEFAVSKSLSRFHQDRNGSDNTQIPGLWLALVTSSESSDLKFASARIGRRVPMLGHLSAILYLRGLANIDCTVDSHLSRMEMQISFPREEGEDFTKLQSFVHAVFSGARCVGGSVTRACEALADSNWQLVRREVVEDRFVLMLSLPLIRHVRSE